MINKKILFLKEEIVRFMRLCQTSLEECVHGLNAQDAQKFSMIIDTYEPRANALELEVDELCTEIIAQYEPKAKDLRAILMFLKMSNDLERIADHCVNIAESGQRLLQILHTKDNVMLHRIGLATISMFNRALNAHIDQDAALARDVCLQDSEVDSIKYEITRHLMQAMAQDNSIIAASLDVLRIAGNYERIADLTTNLCEEIVFIEKGKTIKHHKDTL